MARVSGDHAAACAGASRTSHFLTGAHRSGTTWLARMLAASGVWYVHEPFAPRRLLWPENFSYRPADSRDDAADRVMGKVLAGGHRKALQLPHADHPLMPLRLFGAPVRRVLVKDPLACLLSAYLTRRFGLQTLILFRHPAGFASSVCRLGWPRGAFIRQFLADDRLMDTHLSRHRALLERHANEDSIESAAVLHGALNSVLWNFVEEGVGACVKFEDLCADPLERLQSLFLQLNLPYGEEVREAHRLACFGVPRPSGDYPAHAVARNSGAMAKSWVGELTAAQVAAIRGIWDRFAIPLYTEELEWHVPASGSDAMHALPAAQSS